MTSALTNVLEEFQRRRKAQKALIREAIVEAVGELFAESVATDPRYRLVIIKFTCEVLDDPVQRAEVIAELKNMRDAYVRQFWKDLADESDRSYKATIDAYMVRNIPILFKEKKREFYPDMTDEELDKWWADFASCSGLPQGNLNGI